MAMILPAPRRSLRHLGHLGFRIRPGLLRRIANKGGDPQAEFQWRQVAIKCFAKRLQPIDALSQAIQRFAPEELHVGLGRGDPFGSLGGTSEIEPGMAAIADWGEPWRHGRGCDLEIFPGEGDVFFGP